MNTNNEKNDRTPLKQLLMQKPVVINIGLKGFADDLDAQQFKVIQLDWRPPAGGDAKLADLLSRLGS